LLVANHKFERKYLFSLAYDGKYGWKAACYYYGFGCASLLGAKKIEDLFYPIKALANAVGGTGNDTNANKKTKANKSKRGRR
jgi:hypothetical protein